MISKRNVHHVLVSKVAHLLKDHLDKVKYKKRGGRHNRCEVINILSDVENLLDTWEEADTGNNNTCMIEVYKCRWDCTSEQLATA